MSARPRFLPSISLLALLIVGSACNEEASQGTSTPPVTVDDDASGGDAAGDDATDLTDPTGPTDPPDATPPSLDTEVTLPDAAADTGSGGDDAGAGTDPDTAVEPDTSDEEDGGTVEPPPPMGDEADPWAAGPYTWVRSEIRVPDAEGTLAALLFLPTGGPEAGPYPVVIFNHGFSLNAGQFASYGEHLASHGFIGILPTTGDNALSARTHVRLAEDTIALLDWIDEQAAGERASVFDATRIGASGHSRGGKQSIFAATLDERIRASFTLDPVDSPPPANPLSPSNPADFPSVAPERMSDFRIPGGFVGAGLSAQGVGFGSPACAPENDNYAQYYASAAGPSYSYLIADAGHLEFADSCGFLCRTCRAGSQAAWVRSFSRGTMVAFYYRYLRDDVRYDTWLNGPQLGAQIGRRSVTVQTRNLGP
jgi:hypothetical protein